MLICLSVWKVEDGLEVFMYMYVLMFTCTYANSVESIHVYV